MNIDTDCTDNGTGLRTTIYVSGCWHFCKGCHNPTSWNKRHGTEMSIDHIVDIVKENTLSDVTISGGDGLTWQYTETLELVKSIKETTGKNIWLYTGYTFEEVLEEKRDILNYIDVLVDGKFILAERDYTIMFRGSRNQRIIDVATSLQRQSTVLWRNGEYR
ncbi:anaerobic ribonucleoside-triphosphate reductase activating protein [Lentibacillus saliphilus]|uniref:anaerobic ribonucleoside-triphosphate reductase activating protein n=1 Tax=Lentibacillus saliphilus TaxID=2737028 RepID=UPI003CCEAC2F